MSDNSAQADLAISVVRDGFMQGLSTLGLSEGEAEGVYQAGPNSMVSGPFWWTSSQEAVLHNMKTLAGHIARWRDTRRMWAEVGQRDNGSSYSWTTWFEEGRGYAGDIAFQTGVHTDGSVFRSIADTVIVTGGTIAEGGGRVIAGVGETAQVLGKNLHWLALGLGLLAVAYVGKGLVR